MMGNGLYDRKGSKGKDGKVRTVRKTKTSISEGNDDEVRAAKELKN